MKKKITVINLLLVLVILQLPAQNLVPNPSFETYSSCPTTLDQVGNAPPWYRPTDASSDYYNACAGAGISTPTNGQGTQTPRTGDAYMGCITYLSSVPGNYREYIQAPLTSPLTAGQQYYAEVYVSLTEGSIYEADGIGMLFTNGPLLQANATILMCGAVPCVAQVNNTPNNIINDMTNWVQISGTFTAVGGEDHITVGSFWDDNNTVVGGPNMAGIWPTAYLFIEDVCVTPVGGTGCTGILPVELLSFHVSEENGTVLLEWETATEVNNDRFEIQSSTDGTDFETVGSVKGKGYSNEQTSYSWQDMEPEASTMYYRLRQVDHNGLDDYSEKVAVQLSQVAGEVKVYPTRTTGLVNIATNGITIDHLTVHTLFGEQVVQLHAEQLQQSVITIELGHQPPGIYFVRLHTSQGIIIRKLIKQ